MTQTAGSDIGGPDIANSDAGRLVMAPGRRIELSGVLNLRDVGGYPADGGSVRWRTLLRSDALHKLDASGTAMLAGLGLQTVLDLRTQAEADNAPSVLDGLRGRVVHASLLGSDLAALASSGGPPSGLDVIYRYFIEECGPAIAGAVGELASDGAFPALVHCSAGKDRTGVVVALILAVLGVPDEIIAADYALSETYLDPERTPAIGQLQASTGLGSQLTISLLASPPELMLEVLASVRSAAGSVEGYLIGHGLTPGALAALRAALIV